MGQVLIGDLSQADLGNGQVALLDQAEQQLERALERVKVQLKRG